MFAKPEDVRARRIKRHLKAGASILVALAAGTFLACQKSVPGPSPQGPDARTGPQPRLPVDASLPQTAAPVDAGAPPTVDAGAPDTGLVVVRDSGLDVVRTAPHAPRVDRHQHRTGMPVPDNLLE